MDMIGFVIGFIAGNVIVLLLLLSVFRVSDWVGDKWERYLHRIRMQAIREYEEQRKRI